MVKVRRALISVSDKTGLEGLVKVLNKFGVEILSTGGTAKAIRTLGIPVKDVSEHTGFPEMLDGRVKTLHPKVHGGLLALRENKEHMDTVKKHEIGLIDMVVVNLYPFERTVSKPGVKLEEAIENIDIGGPSMLRSAAKNHRSVCVLCDVADYDRVAEEMEKTGGSVSEELCTDLGIKVFNKTSTYDAAIYGYLRDRRPETVDHRPETGDKGEGFPQILELKYKKLQDLRYGENPHQKAAFYKDESSDESSVSGAVQLQGKELSFNNIIDLNAALEIVKEFGEPAATIIKHTNPCGTATAKSLKQAYIDALDCDRLSAFGSIVGFNGPVDTEVAKTILEEADFVECIIAPSYDAAALQAFKAKKNLRLLEVKNFGAKAATVDKDMKKVVGGMLIQDRDVALLKEIDLKFVTKVKPTKEQLASLLFGWVVAKHVKSNAIVLCQGTKTVGVGAGQMSRVVSVMIACNKADKRAKGSTLASDAFFPKEDGIEQAHQGGIAAIIQPGGSIRDAEVIKMADKLGIAMVFTGMRHFKH
ncbi:MAG: bifunctional phosphoribosylaminoimidazolecarboxamide formyltransferase/IMP cyclohydrolase [Candidatus Omnitrophica bacterium]|nr:bifunctional phosphoribosylaminoimidazolecarboxamide formyltransferase/IMP cyclohydrolase [Candidatus Omnitrophota bacterium]MDD5436923.1 bifunctional phosphoribosylaminoimidazolecarboxamide formyltransferase/IMP cyclohydrolase [Candidatus Omnitrophota bacterium]